MIDLTRFSATNQDVHGLLDRRQALQSEAHSTKKAKAEPSAIPRHKHGDRFVRGPVPYEWLRVALSVGGKAGHLARAIWRLAGIERTNPIRLTRRVLQNFNVSTRSARRLLSDFERAGLVKADRKRGRGPIVTLLAPTPEEPADD